MAEQMHILVERKLSAGMQEVEVEFQHKSDQHRLLELLVAVRAIGINRL